MIPYPQIDPVIFALGPLQVRWYGLMYVLGFIAVHLLVGYQARRYGLRDLAREMDNLNLVLIISLVVGGRLGYVLFYNLGYYLRHPLEILATWHGGMSFHGSLIGLLLAGWLYCRRAGLDFLRGADVYIVAVPIGLGLGRLGNFINGELYGRVTDVPWGMIFPGGGPLPRHPSQLYESFLEGLVLFVILWNLRRLYWRAHNHGHDVSDHGVRNWPAGSLLAAFLAGYGLIRFGVEFFREPDPQLGLIAAGLSMGQLLSLLMLTTAAGLWLYGRSRPAGGLKSGGLKSLVLLLFPGIMALAMIAPPASPAAEIAPRLHKTVLANGLTVIAKQTPGTGVATVQVWVRAGSVFETPAEAGITHLIEHMIFKGTASRGPGQVAGEIEALGGRINAYTTYEHTVYHATLAARHWQAALEVLADAVLNSTFDPAELEREKVVVLEEIRMRRDRPEIALFQEMMSRAYTTHPYRLPISGTEESVMAISRENILAYMANHYRPENLMVVVVVGDVNPAEVLAKSSARFGGSKNGQTPATAVKLPPEPPQENPRLFSLVRDVNQTNLALALPAPAFKHLDTPALDVLIHILGQGEASRLYHRLRHELGLVYRIDASLFSSHDPGLIQVSATLEATQAPAALQEIMAEMLALSHFPVSDEELTRAKRNLEADFIFNLERAEGLARVLGSFELLTNDPRDDDYLDRLRAVSQEDLMRVAAAYFRPHRLTAGLLGPAGTETILDQAGLTALLAEAEQAARQADRAAAGPEAAAPVSYQLGNGITLLVKEQREVPTVAIRAVFPGGLRSESEATNGAFAFLADLLPKGTERLSSRQMAHAVADLAGELEGFNGKNTFGVKADFLSRFFRQGLTLVRDVLLTPAFDPEEAEKIRAELLSQLKRQEDSLSSLAFREFNRQLFRGHPYGLNTAGSEAAIRALSVAQLREILQQHARPERLVLTVVGDVEAAAVKQEVGKLFGAWPGRPAADSLIQESLLPPDPPLKPELVAISRDKEQVHVVIGFLGATMTSPDRFPLEILDQVLSGQSGRLFTELRDRHSLAYSLSSFSLLGIDTGAFGVYIGTSPDRREEAIKALWQQLYRLQQEEISPAELERARNVLIGNYRLGLQTHGAQAMEMALNQTYGLGLDFSDRYVRALEAVTPAEVLAAARRYIQPDRHVMVTVGGATAAPANR